MMMSASSRQSQAAERNVRLDPQGIYGTRSARRQSQLRRRRQLQNLFLWLVGALVLGVLVWWLLQPRQSARSASWTRELPFRPATPPIALGQGEMLFTSQSGGLWRWKAPLVSAPQSGGIAGAPQRFFSTDFAPAATPLLTNNQVFWPGGDGVLRALDRKSGVQKWRGVLSSALVCTPALAEIEGRKIVVVGDDEGIVAAFDAVSGALQWKTDLGGAVGAGIGVFEVKKPLLSAPVVQASPLVASLPAKAKNSDGAGFLVPLLSGASSRGGLVCLDARTGRVKWRFPGDTRAQSAGVAAPRVLGNQVFWCNDEGAAVCLDARTGQKIWKVFAAPHNKTASSLVSLRGGASIIEAAGVVTFGGSDGWLRALDLATGAPRWEHDLGGAIRFAAQTPVFEGQPHFLAAGDAPAIFLFDARTGRVVRRWTTVHAVSHGLTVEGGGVYALDAGGHLQGAALN